MWCHRKEADLQNSGSCEPTIGANPQKESTCPSSLRRWLSPSSVSLRFAPILHWAESHIDPPQRLQALEIDPEHAVWAVGPNGIQAKDLRLAALEQVSPGSWQPRLFFKPQI